MKTKGFTLIEVMIVICILGIILATLAPCMKLKSRHRGEIAHTEEQMESPQESAPVAISSGKIQVDFVDGTSQTFDADHWDATGDVLHIFYKGTNTVMASIPKERIKLWKGVN